MPRARAALRSGRAAARLVAAALLILVAWRVDAAADATAPRSHVVVGCARDYPPFEFVGRDGEVAGYNVDLTRAIADVMGMTVEFRTGRWADMRAALERGEIDLLQGISWSEERARTLEFAPPHAVVHQAIFARRDTPPVSSLDELKGHDVIVFRGGIMDDSLTRRGLGDHLVRAESPAQAMRMLASGKHEYVALALLPGIYITRELKLTNVVPVANRVSAERYGYAVRKGDTELLARFDEGLAILKKTGRYDAIHARWLGVLEPQRTPWRTVARYAAIVALPLLLLLGGTFVWSRSLQKLVAQRTESLAREVAERQRAVEDLRVHQAQLVQAGKMTALGVLVSGVAHEVNNPNGLVLLNLPILKEAFRDAAELLDEHPDRDRLMLARVPYPRMRLEIPTMLDDMAAGAIRIKRIVEDLKDFARREDAPSFEAVDLNEVARAAARLVDGTMRKSTRRFEVDLAPGLPRVRGNAQRIEQVVVNLLVNASQALPDATRAVVLRTRADGDGDGVVLEVADEGVGIAPEDLPRLTDPFFTTRRESGGTGLGLSVSASIVKEHGGTLSFESRLGAGTTARVSLQRWSEEAAA